MSLLSDYGLRQAMGARDLVISPAPVDIALQGASIDLTLGNTFHRFAMPPLGHGYALDTKLRPEMDTTIVKEGEPYRLESYGFALGCTVEHVTLGRNIAAQIDGKSTLGRMGLFVHATAGWIDPGFSGQITLELFNATPYALLIWPHTYACQLYCHRMTSTPLRAYGEPGAGSHYQGSVGPIPSAGVVMNVGQVR